MSKTGKFLSETVSISAVKIKPGLSNQNFQDFKTTWLCPEQIAPIIPDCSICLEIILEAGARIIRSEQRV